MESFSVTVDIATPIQMGAYPLHLDGLLYWILEEEFDYDRDKALKMLDTLLAKKDGVFLSSSMAAYLTRFEMVTQGDTTYSGSLDWGEYPYPLRKKKVATSGGVYRNRIKTYNGISVPKIIFHGVGDIDKLERIFKMIPGVGMNAKRGAGEIIGFTVNREDEDYSFIDSEARLTRILPKKIYDKYGFDDKSATFENVNYQPPYSVISNTTLCAIPDFRVVRY